MCHAQSTCLTRYPENLTSDGLTTHGFLDFLHSLCCSLSYFPTHDAWQVEKATQGVKDAEFQICEAKKLEQVIQQIHWLDGELTVLTEQVRKETNHALI